MADPVAQKPPPAPPVAAGSPPGAPGQPAPGDAAALAVKFGGNKGGRPRKDGLVPGSAEALLADREKDASRKRDTRAQARTLLALSQAPAPVATLPGGADPGTAPAPGQNLHPWDPGLVAPVFEQVVPAIEKLLVARLGAKAAKAKLPLDLVKEIERDAAFAAPAKAAIVTAGPVCVAKWLNAAGIGAEHAPEVILGTAVASIAAAHFMLCARLDNLVKEANKPQPQKSDAKSNENSPSNK